MSMKKKFRESKRLIGKVFGRLTVIEYTQQRQRTNVIWKCRCDCGNEVFVPTESLRNNHKRSCGCLGKEGVGKNHSRFTGYEEIYGAFFYHIKISASRRNIPFKVTIKDLWELFLKQNRRCALSDVELSFGTREKLRSKECTASLDRIDSSKGYTKDNIQWIHKDLNYIKCDFSEEDLLGWVEKIYNYKLKQKSS